MRQLTIDGREVITHSLPSAGGTEGKQGAETEQMPLFSVPQTIPGQLGFPQVDLTDDAGSAKHHEGA